MFRLPKLIKAINNSRVLFKKRMINNDNNETSGKIFSIYGEPLGVGDPNVIEDDQITVSSDENHLPRLYHTTWSPGVDYDEEHWVKIDFRKFVLVKAIQILSPLSADFGSFSRAAEIVIEFNDSDGNIVTYNNGEVIIGNSECDTVQIIPLTNAIHTNGIRLFIKGLISLQVGTIQNNYL